jgi:hypothetical protein
VEGWRRRRRGGYPELRAVAVAPLFMVLFQLLEAFLMGAVTFVQLAARIENARQRGRQRHTSTELLTNAVLYPGSASLCFRLTSG